jgi:hypothetical protein
VPCVEKKDGGLTMTDYYCGPVYSGAWIENSILQNTVLQKEPYHTTTIDDSYNVRSLKIGKGKRYSIMEAYTLYQICGSKTLKQLDSSFWQRLFTNNVLPGRSIDSMKSFWKHYSSVTFEHFLIESLHIKRDYCLTHTAMPKEIELEFRKKFAHLIEDWEYKLEHGEVFAHDEFDDSESFGYHKATPQALNMSQRTMDDS